MIARKTRLVDCNPRWSRRWTPDGADEAPVNGIMFDCPEAHEGCQHYVPFTPALDGSAQTSSQTNGALWQRTGDTFETLTLSPSIRRIPVYADRAAALAAGCAEHHINAGILCALHIFIRDGQIEFCGDSR